MMVLLGSKFTLEKGWQAGITGAGTDNPLGLDAVEHRARRLSRADRVLSQCTAEGRADGTGPW